MGFKAADIEPMGYDFRPAVEAVGTIAEPSNDRLETFYTMWQEMLRENLRSAEEFAPPVDAKGEPVYETAHAKAVREDAGMAAAKERAPQIRQRRIEMLAYVCEASPDVDTLAQLPSRVLTAFQDYMFKSFSPEA